jgi:hypothetical protein
MGDDIGCKFFNLFTCGRTEGIVRKYSTALDKLISMMLLISSAGSLKEANTGAVSRK